MNLRVTFDSLVLSVVCGEAQIAIGANVRKVLQPDAHTLTIRLKGPDFDGGMTMSCDPAFFRLHLDSVFQRDRSAPDHFGRIVREKIEGGRLLAIRQHGFDRVCHMRIGKDDGEYLLAAHLTGTHANLFLVSPADRILAKCRRAGNERVGDRYQPPSTPAESLDDAIRKESGIPRIILAQIEAHGEEAVRKAIQARSPVLIPGVGAYPFQPLGFDSAIPMSSLSAALEQHYLQVSQTKGSAQRRASLEGQLRRARDSRKKALALMEASLDAAERAEELQSRGELILAYGAALQPGADSVDAIDHEGNPLRIAIDPKKTPVENAERLFRKAKNAKSAAKEVGESYDRKRRELVEIESALEEISTASDEALEELESRAKEKRWLREATLPVSKERREFDGHRIKRSESPAGYPVLWGETATANDYLTTRVAKGNDWWLHVRGHTGAHVIIQTSNKPGRVQRPDIEFAARIAARTSVQKHAKDVPVDFTLAKHVRKPRKSAPGLATYTNEKTVYVDP